jgi:DNA-binding MarR family transcriptional regulator
MNAELSALLQDLLVSAHRLTRVAARSTGNTTPSAVWHTLSILVTDGPMRIGDLARAGRVSQPTMTKLLQHLVTEELVYRIADVDDSRAWLIAVTRKGNQALADWRAELSRALDPMFADLTPNELASLTDAVAILQARTSTNRQVA